MHPHIESSRLKLIPLTLAQAEMMILDNGSMEKELELYWSGLPMDDYFKNVLINIYLPRLRLAGPEHIYFNTPFMAVYKESNEIAASLMLKDKLNALGEIEIGYGTNIPYRNQGIMTEALGLLLKWFSGKELCKIITAETIKTNIASIKILKSNGFKMREELAESIWWEKSID